MRQTTFGLANLLGGLVLIMVFSAVGLAQFRAGVQGVVTDNAGGTVGGATVTLTNKETNDTRSTTTSDEGSYRFSALPPGLYSLSVEKENFKKSTIDDLKVDAETVRGQDVRLEAGVISEVVTVQADNAGLQTEDASLGKTITNDEVLQLPQTGRDPYELARLTPGVFGAGARSGGGSAQGFPNTSGPGGSNSSIFQTENQVAISANGQRLSSNNFQIDGSSVNSQTWGGAAVITPSQESVKEVQVLASTYSAEDGRNSGVQIKTVSQNGTNEWHGSLFFKYNDPGWNAFNSMPRTIGTVSTQGPQRVERRSKTFGGSVGGKIIPDRLFFFFAYEGFREKNNSVRNTFIETAQFRQSVLAARPGTPIAAILSASGIEPRVVQILAPTCQDIFVTCAIVGNGIDIGSMLGPYGTYVRTVSTEPIGGGLDGIADMHWAQLETPTSFDGNQYFTRIDFEATDKDHFAFSSYFTPVTAFSADSSAQSRPMSDISSKRLNYVLGFIYNRSFSPNLVNEARVNMTRWGYSEIDSNPDARFDLPRVEIEGFFPDRLRFGPPWGLNTPGDILERQLDFRDIVRYTRGRHTLSFGGEYRIDLNSNFELGGARPLYSFHRLWNFANGTPIFETLTANNAGFPTANNTSFKTGDLAFFAQDNYLVLPNLTLNLGLRWEYFSPITARGDDVLGNLVLGPTGSLTGATITTDKQLTESDLNNFGPQFGFTWAPEKFKDHLVIRGGFGVGYDRLANALLANARRNPPNGAIYGLCCGTAVGEFGSPFAGGQIVFDDSSDGTIFGFPQHPLIGGGTNPATGLPNLGSIEIYGTPRKLPNSTIFRYSLEAQYELPWRLVGSLGYQGSKGKDFVRIDRVHITNPGSNPRIFAAYFARPDVDSDFNALLATLRSRFTNGLGFTINYRYAKSLDTSSYEAPCACTDQSFPVDQRQEHGPSDFDVRHNVTASAIYDLPFYRSQSSLAGKLLGGWQVSTIVTYHTGYPWTPKIFGCLNTTGAAGFCDPRPTSYNGTRPDTNSNENFLRPGGIFGAAGTTIFGTAFNGSDPFANPPAIGRNALFGPKYFSTDVSLVKRFGLSGLGPLSEGAGFDIRFNFFNVFNTLNLTPFNSNSDPTRVQLTAFGTALSGLAGRVTELQVRFNF